MVLSEQISETLKDEVRRELFKAGKITIGNYSKRREVGFTVFESAKGAIYETKDVYMYKYIYRLPYEPMIPAFHKIK